MRRFISLGIVIGALIAGAFITSQVAGGGPLLAFDDILDPDASVFVATADQRLLLLGAVVAAGAVTFGMGATLAIAVNLLDKAYRQAMSEEAPAEALTEILSAEDLGIHLPAPSIAPLIVGFGAMLIAFSILLPPLIFVGLIVLLLGVGGWAASATNSH